MKILKLIFENINSLKGKWQIDFEDPAFHHHALFTITGPTGAGKTTILDAICLALYGETPRLKISPSQNELMSIGTAFAASTVIFRANDKLYQASWSQRRANQKSDGKLQAVSREISELRHVDDTDGRIIEEKASLVNGQIERILGMNKTQFTRSVMLVQGEFAAFLRSDAAERGQILEQITGTQIYAQISQAAFEKQKQQNHLLKDLQLKLGEVQLLSTDDYQTLLDQIASISDQKNQTESQLNHTQSQIELATQYSRLSQEIQNFENKIIQNQSDIEDFSADLSRLTHAKHAQSIEPLYQTAKDNDEHHQLKTAEKTQLNQSLNALQTHVNRQQDHQSHIQENLHKKIQDYEAIKPNLHAARKLDLEILTAVQDHTHLAQSLQKHHQNLDHSQHILKQLFDDQRRIQIDIAQYSDTLDAQQVDDLSNKFHQKEQSLSQFDTLSKALLHAHRLYLADVQKLKNALSELSVMRDDYQAMRDQVNQTSKELHDQKNEFYSLLNIHNIDEHAQASVLQQQLGDIQQSIKTDSHTLHILEQIKLYDQQYAPLLDEISTLKQQKTMLDNERTAIENALQSVYDQIQQTKQNQSIQLEKFGLQTQILQLKAQLDQLSDGDACPLCGSTEHPYKHSAHPSDTQDAAHAKAKLDAIENALDELQLLHEAHKNSLNSLTIAIENNSYKLTNLHKDSDNLHQKMHDLWAQIHDRFTLTGLPSQHAIDALIKQTQTNIDHLDKTLEEASALIGRIQITEGALDKLLYEKQSIGASGTKASQDAQALLLDVHAAGHHLKQNLLPPLIELLDADDHGLDDLRSHLSLLQNALLDLSADAERIEQNRGSSKQILPQANDIHIPNQADGTLINQAHAAMSRVCADLSHQIHIAKSQSDQLDELKSKLVELEIKIDLHQHKIQELQPEIHDLNLANQAKSAEAQALRSKRFALIGEAQIDALEHSHQTQISDLRSKLDQSTIQLQADIVQLESQKAKAASLDAILDELTKKLTLSQSAYQDALAQSIFGDEAEFLAARLSNEQLSILQQTADQLHDALKQNQISLKHSQAKLNELLAIDARINEADLDALLGQRAQLQSSWTSIHQQIGELNAIKTNELKSRERQAALIADIEKQQQENAIWTQLNALIGSENGNKYRNFVQGLTLDLVLQHANQILSKMNDRYLLTVDEDEGKSLEILVTDLHQGDAIRSSKNLSGGESFIISLALALGLSQINSKNVQIESLFLDEGFGTLDEAALDLALTTLFELQQSGKSIGIISHVTSLKERIDTQILVQKHAGGHSVLYGAGVTQLG